MQPTKKIDLLTALMSENKWNEALSLASKFPRLGEHKAAIVRAHECIVNPRFYTQIGVNIDEAISAGIDALKIRYAS